MINISHLYKTYAGPVHALKNISLKIEKGEFVFLVGPSGSGKSTLFKMISCFDRSTSGSIEVANYDLNTITSRDISFFRRRIGVVFQDFKLLKDRTVFENIALPLRIRGDRPHLIQKRVMDTLEQVGLKDKFDELPEHLSGGEQQRIAIARAIVHQPGLLIADEPTGNLDPELSEEIMDLFERISVQGTTVFIATHDHEMVKRRRKRTLELRDGVLREDLELLR